MIDTIFMGCGKCIWAVMIMYKPLADSTLMRMTKKEIIEQLRIAEHNFKAMEETVNQQAENCKKLLAEERQQYGAKMDEGVQK